MNDTTPPLEPNPPLPASRRRVFAATVSVAALYVFFLIHVEFAFLELVLPYAGDARPPLPLLALGLGGLAGSVLNGFLFRPAQARWLLAGGFVGCALSGWLALLMGSAGIAAVAALLTGLAVGWTTVGLVRALRPSLHTRHLGLVCGVGTGMAYGICNLPIVFEAAPADQALAGIVAVGFGAVAALFLQGEPVRSSTAVDFRPTALVGWTAVFLALVWLDSAAFYTIQHTQPLKAASWAGDLTLYGNAILHALSAVLAGAALSRQRFPLTVVVAGVLLVSACLLFGARRGELGRVLYVVAVSAYSTALVYYPARSGRVWHGVVIYGVAGWIGSAIGIGIAQDFQRLPAWAVGAAGALMLAGLTTRTVARVRAAAALLVGAPLLFLAASPSPASAADVDPEVRLGREVYVAEGCMSCHSQYVRPGTEDVLAWGPVAALAERLREKPPLFGNRRMGPDLSNVGLRRTPEWNQVHLQHPRLLSPGSRMPAYAHLFSGGDPRGPALVQYLASLGEGRIEERLRQIAAWEPAPTAPHTPAGTRSAALYTQLCAQCHGTDAAGQGPAATRLGSRPANLRGPWLRVDPQDETRSLARIIKFGVPGTAMAGHEYLSDQEVMDLVGQVRALRAGNRVP